VLSMTGSQGDHLLTSGRRRVDNEKFRQVSVDD
jgi:hypothetical protein